MAVQAVGTGTNTTTGAGALFWLTPNTSTNAPSTYTYASPASVNGVVNSNAAGGPISAGGSPTAPTGIGGVQVAAGGSGYTAADVRQNLDRVPVPGNSHDRLFGGGGNLHH